MTRRSRRTPLAIVEAARADHPVVIAEALVSAAWIELLEFELDGRRLATRAGSHLYRTAHTALQDALAAGDPRAIVAGQMQLEIADSDLAAVTAAEAAAERLLAHERASHSRATNSAAPP